MNKAQIIKHMMVKYKCSEEEAYKIIEIFTRSVIDIVSLGDEVLLVNFGRFKINKIKARIGQNPKTMEPVQIPESNIVRFTAGKLLKEACNSNLTKKNEKPKKAKSQTKK